MLNIEQASIVKGMIARGDRLHDIAAHFECNSARIAEIKAGTSFPNAKAAGSVELPARKGRFVDPRAPFETQRQQLLEIINNPPDSSREMIISPQLAAWILEVRNQQNRKRRPAKIKVWANSMTDRSWMLTGQAVIFGKSGQLLDGQNRLSACVLSGVQFPTDVRFGIDDKAFAFIDTNSKRTGADALHVAGVKSSSIASAAVRWIMINEKGNPQDRGASFENAELLDFYKGLPAAKIKILDDAVSAAHRIGSVIPRGQLAAHIFLFTQSSVRTADKFVVDLERCRGGGRTLIERLRLLKKQNMGRLHETQVNALLIQAWNAYRSGTRLYAKMLNWNDTKDYPSIK